MTSHLNIFLYLKNSWQQNVCLVHKNAINNSKIVLIDRWMGFTQYLNCCKLPLIFNKYYLWKRVFEEFQNNRLDEKKTETGKKFNNILIICFNFMWLNIRNEKTFTHMGINRNKYIIFNNIVQCSTFYGRKMSGFLPVWFPNSSLTLSN